MWRASEHTLEENALWVRLRAIEWQSWPQFLSQPIVPFLLYFYPSSWLAIIVLVLIFDVLWTYVALPTFISPLFAFIGVLFVRLKWIACPLTALFLWRDQHPYIAILALTWPLVVLLISAVTLPFKAPVWKKYPLGTIEERFMSGLGYVNTDRE